MGDRELTRQKAWYDNENEAACQWPFQYRSMPIAPDVDRRLNDIRVTGAKAERKGLNEALAYARPGDIFIVSKLDRAGRSLKHLIELLYSLDQHQIGFRSLTSRLIPQPLVAS